MLEVKMITVSGTYKALVLDMTLDEGNRLVCLFEGIDYDLVYNEALAFTKKSLWH